MFNWPFRSLFYLIISMVCLPACGEPPDLGAVAETGPVLARVGGMELRPDDVGPLARQAAELRRELGLQVGEAGRLELAVEFLALLQLEEIADGRKRLLIRTYLDRMFADEEKRPVTDAELKQAHADEIRKYLTTGESGIYRPTVIDAAAIVVGCFPDLHPPQDDEIPVQTMEQARELAGKIAAACGGRVPDLDDFMSIARRFMQGHPTVEVQESSRVFEDPRLARTPRKLHQVIMSLKDNGAVSAPVEGPGAVYVIRRGVTYPGKGESPGEVKDELSNRVRLSRKQTAFRERLNRLRERYRARSWPERLRGLE